MKTISGGLDTHLQGEVTSIAEKRQKNSARRAKWYRANPEKGRAACKLVRDNRKTRGLVAYSTEDYRRNKDEIQKQRRQKNAALRRQVIEHYGVECRCCGERQYEFLALDHVHGGGRKQQKELGSTFAIYVWIIKKGYPDSIQILCHNCNMAKGLYGQCPHQKGEEHENHIHAA